MKQRLQFKSPVPEIEATNGDWCCQDLPTMLAWFIVSLKTLLISQADILRLKKKQSKQPRLWCKNINLERSGCLFE